MEKKKLSLVAFVLMILTSVFGVANIGIGFYRMGYVAIPMFIVGGLFYFVPYTLMMIEFGTGFKNESGGIYTWMRRSVNVKFAFVTIFLWYASYLIWMFNKSLTLWVPLSYALLGQDITTMPLNVGGLYFGPFLIGVLAIIFTISIGLLVSTGPSKFAKISAIGGLAVIALNIILILGGIFAFVYNGFELQETLNVKTLTTSPNVEYQSLLPFLGFLVFSVFVFGGMEAMAGVSDELENPERDLKKGIALSSFILIGCQVVGILMVGAIMPWSEFGDNVSSLQSLFIIMQNLGATLGHATGGDGHILGQILLRFSGFAIFLTFVGGFIALTYAPLIQLIEGTPKEFWPESFKKQNKHGMPIKAIIAQATIVVTFLALKSIFGIFDPEGANKLYELAITMTNVSMTIPYIFLIFAWYKYRQNDNLKKDIIMIKSKAMVLVATILSLTVVIFGNVFTIISPFLQEKPDIETGVWTIIGPLAFLIMALLIYNKAKKRNPNLENE